MYLCAINIVTFLRYGWDKYKAVQNERSKKAYRRTPEKVLISLAVVGGSIGALLGMLMFRHKIRKPKFYLGVPAIIFLQAALIVSFGILR
ncbi:MAG: DUF1294 domain-containing protein [Tyzzerella sp.]|nr:DUF1294 domain-containing protein [Tyzzerella sp.]